jgi:hypothetical protein
MPENSSVKNYSHRCLDPSVGSRIESAAEPRKNDYDYGVKGTVLATGQNYDNISNNNSIQKEGDCYYSNDQRMGNIIKTTVHKNQSC